MRREPREYSIEELVEHPLIRLAMESNGLDRRALELMADEAHRDFRSERSWREEPISL